MPKFRSHKRYHKHKKQTEVFLKKSEQQPIELFLLLRQD